MALWSFLPTVEQFQGVSISEALAASEHAEDHYYGFKLQEWGAQARERGDNVAEAVYHILATACLMMLKPESHDEPFEPFAVFPPNRSAVPSDISDGELDLLQTVAPAITDSEVRARIADLIWVRRRHFPSALIAIDAYLKSAANLAVPMWPSAVDRFRRAIILAISIRNENEYKKVVEAVENALVDADHSWLVEGLMTILFERREGDADAYAAECERRAVAAEEATEDDRLREARHMWRLAARWHARQQRVGDERRCQLAAAETYVMEAEREDSAMIRMVRLNRAIEALSRMSGTEERVREIKLGAQEAQQQSRGEMTQVEMKIESQEVAAAIAKAREAARGLSIQDALKLLAGEFAFNRVSTLRENAEQAMKDFPIQFLVSTVTLTDNDRIVSQSFGDHSDPEKEHEATLRREMYRQASIMRSMLVMGACEPIRQQIYLEHHVTLDDMMYIVKDNPFIPAGRERLFARGLLAGLAGVSLKRSIF